MTSTNVADQLSVYRNLLQDLGQRLGTTDRTTLYMQARSDHDALTCLLEEQAEEKAASITELLDRYERLMRSLVN